MRKKIAYLIALWAMAVLLNPIEAKAQTMADNVAGQGMGAIFDEIKTEEEYLKAADQEMNNYGYKHLGVANVDNHLNVREQPGTDSKLVGKMSRNNGCEVLSVEGDWAHIQSGDVDGYVHTDYLLMGGQAIIRADKVIAKSAKATEGGLRVRSEPNTECQILTTMGEGERMEVLNILDGWIEVDLDGESAYISADYAVIEEKLDTAVTMSELLYGDGISSVRIDMCQYAKEFIGNPYVWGGASLTNGTDCSGFTMQIYKKYGIKLPHSSAAQSKMGTSVNLSQAKAGDLVFYAAGGSVNHVALYVGNGQVVHASNPKQGIKISPVGYRTIHSIRRIIND